MPGRLPPTLLGGRVRTSTLLLLLCFVAVLTLYLLVRPPPAGDTGRPGGLGSAGGPATQPSTSRPGTTSPTSTAPGSTTTTGQSISTRGTPTTSTTPRTTGSPTTGNPTTVTS